MLCPDCEFPIEDNEYFEYDKKKLCEECYLENIDICAICEKHFPIEEKDSEGEYHFVFSGSEKNPEMKPGIYRAHYFPFFWSIMFGEAKIVESAVTWVSQIPDDSDSGKICGECIQKYVSV